MATAQLNTSNRIGPFVVSIKKSGDNTERFISLAGTLLTFNEAAGNNTYESRVTDALGNTSTQLFSMTCGQLSNCDEGPTLREILSRNAFGLKYQFHGNGVNQARWNVLKNNQIVDSGISIPGSPVVDVVFSNKLSPGSYVFEISGYSCYSANPSSLGFIIPVESGTLEWLPDYPSFDFDANSNSYRILRAANIQGSFLSKITKISTGDVVESNTIDYAGGNILITNNIQPGLFRVQLGTLITDLTVTSIVNAPLAIGIITVVQALTGEYILTVNFSGGSPSYLLQVKTQANAVISIFPNTTGSPAILTLPQGTIPQTVKVSVTDSVNAIVENNNVILPATEPILNFLSANNYVDVPTRTPLTSNGQTFFIGSGAEFNFDVEFVQPNGGLYDYVPKKLEKLVSGAWVEKNLATISGTGSAAVSSTTSKHNLFTPRATRNITIDGVNPFKTAGSWRVTFGSKRGGANGSTFTTITRDFTISTPPELSGIILYQRSASGLGAAVGEILSIGSSFPKPLPFYDIGIGGFNGVPFDNIIAYYRQKVNNVFVQRYAYVKGWTTPQTTLNPADSSIFNSTNLGNLHVTIFAAEEQTWQIEYVGRTGTTTVATRKAEFAFTLGSAAFSNTGYMRKTVAGKEYQDIVGQDFGAETLSTGNKKLYHPATRTSLDGKNTCYPWVYLNHVRMHPDDLTAFRSSTGLAFPRGIHTISIQWFSNVVESYDDVLSGGGAGSAYNLAGENLDKVLNTGAMPDYFTFAIN